MPLPCPHTSGLCDFGPQLRPGKREQRGFQCIHLLFSVSRPAAQSQEPVPAAHAASAHDRAERVQPLRSVQTASVTSLVQLSAPALGRKNGENWRCQGWQESIIPAWTLIYVCQRVHFLDEAFMQAFSANCIPSTLLGTVGWRH